VFKFNGDNRITNSIVTVIFVSALFYYCLKNRNIKLFASIGKNHSANIYYYHWAFIYIITNCITDSFWVRNPIIVFAVSLVFSIAICKGKHLFEFKSIK